VPLYVIFGNFFPTMTALFPLCTYNSFAALHIIKKINSKIKNLKKERITTIKWKKKLRMLQIVFFLSFSVILLFDSSTVDFVPSQE